jgi:NADH-quinone oxidoreductase subunit H
MVSYEVSIGFIIITVLLLVGSLNLTTIVDAQAAGIWAWNGFRIFNFADFPNNILVGVVMLAMLVMFFVSALAETNRPPFDLPEAESELVAGYQVEYSSTPYLLFMIGEYLNIVMMCAMTTILFLGGWHLPWGPVENLGLAPWLTSALGMMIFYVKIWFMFFLFAMVKAIAPRYRYDQLMRLGWKIFLPTSLVAVAVIGYYVTFLQPASATSVAGG